MCAVQGNLLQLQYILFLRLVVFYFYAIKIKVINANMADFDIEIYIQGKTIQHYFPSYDITRIFHISFCNNSNATKCLLYIFFI